MELLPYDSDEGESFRLVRKGYNWMTPRLLGYTKIKNGIAEISTGDKFLGLEMFGITIVTKIENPGRLSCGYVRNDELSKCVNSMEEVEYYINELNTNI